MTRGMRAMTCGLRGGAELSGRRGRSIGTGGARRLLSVARTVGVIAIILVSAACGGLGAGRPDPAPAPAAAEPVFVGGSQLPALF